MRLHKVHKFRMRPNKIQEIGLYQMAGARRYVYNWALARRKEYYVENGKSISNKQLSFELTQLKKQPEVTWLNKANAQCLQQALRDLDCAFNAFFKGRKRFPRFSSKKNGHDTFRIPQHVYVENRHLHIPKIGWVRIHQSQTIKGKTKSATFKRDTTGCWYVSLVTEFEIPDVDLPLPTNPVGVDLGLKDLFVTSKGDRLSAPKFARKADKKLRKAQKNLSRKKMNSKRRERAKLRVAKVHKKVANQRNDFIHKLTTELIRNHDCICLEGLNNAALAKTKLSRSVLDAAFGEFRRQIEYKTLWNYKHCIEISRWFPSTKMCSECGAVNNDLTLKDREWTCSCGVTHDRDLNAAINILREGLRILSEKQLAVGHTDSINAHGEDVRPSTEGEPRGSENPEVGECQMDFEHAHSSIMMGNI